jgi:hypothetical protein
VEPTTDSKRYVAVVRAVPGAGGTSPTLWRSWG